MSASYRKNEEKLSRHQRKFLGSRLESVTCVQKSKDERMALSGTPWMIGINAIGLGIVRQVDLEPVYVRGESPKRDGF